MCHIFLRTSKSRHFIHSIQINKSSFISSPEPEAQGELLPLANVRPASCVVRRPSCVVRRPLSTIALNNTSSASVRPRALIFGM